MDNDDVTIETTIEAIKSQAMEMLANGNDREEIFEWLGEVMGEIHDEVMGVVDYAIEVLADGEEDEEEGEYELPVGGAAID